MPLFQGVREDQVVGLVCLHQRTVIGVLSQTVVVHGCEGEERVSRDKNLLPDLADQKLLIADQMVQASDAY